jgi:poly-gamma-glutamate synthesis protein (capsule biosynthesis protein)
MCGRGIDQILPHPCEPQLFEPFVHSALDYVALTERASGSMPKPVDFSYVWGDALRELERAQPDVRIVNLETAVTTASEPWPEKQIHYRMHPGNVACLAAAKIDCCLLANNHTLDWGRDGLAETLDTLHRAGMHTAGAGRNAGEAAAPALIDLPGRGRVLIFAFATPSAGVPEDWAATSNRSGVSWIGELSVHAADRIGQQIQAARHAGDVVVASIHWGGNWGYDISPSERAFAHRLIDAGGVDIVHGHSAHHPRAIEVYRDRLILYGCGDFLNDYEGIDSYASFRPDLTLMYLPTLDTASGAILELLLMPLQIRRFRLQRLQQADKRWLEARLNREGQQFGLRVESLANGYFRVHWR